MNKTINKRKKKLNTNDEQLMNKHMNNEQTNE